MNFEDDNFTADKERAKEICRRIIAERLQFRETFFFGRTDMADDPELLDLLAEAKLNWVLIGIESLNQASLDEIDKHQSVEDIRHAGNACREHGIQLIASIVLGIDTDSAGDIHTALEFAKSIDASKLQPAILTPFPKTPVYEQYVNENRMLIESERDWQLFDMMNVTFQPRHMSPWELQMLFFTCVCSFYRVRSSLHLGRVFHSPAFALKSCGLAIASHLGKHAAKFAGRHLRKSYYYRLKHMPWVFAGDAD